MCYLAFVFHILDKLQFTFGFLEKHTIEITNSVQCAT
jgi:hypothetical protein